jgi:clan AA aspartic protease (TIGR02281 family)
MGCPRAGFAPLLRFCRLSRATRRLRGAVGVGSALMLASAMAAAAAGSEKPEIYRWTDASGRLHFSQDLSKVPPEQRERSRVEAAERKQRDDRLQIYGRGGSSGGRAAAPAAHLAMRGGGGRSMRIPFERHGSLMRVEVLLNGRVRAPFFIDTGASGVSIPWSVARELGLHITDDTPRITVITANGTVAEPVVVLQSVQLGPARVNDLQAAVSGSMDIGLLGGAFFNNFVYQVDAASGVITLSPNERVRGGLNQAEWRERFEAIRAPLTRLEAYLEAGGFTEESRVQELEQHRATLEGSLEQLEAEADQAGVPRGWRQ